MNGAGIAIAGAVLAYFLKDATVFYWSLFVAVLVS